MRRVEGGDSSFRHGLGELGRAPGAVGGSHKHAIGSKHPPYLSQAGPKVGQVVEHVHRQDDVGTCAAQWEVRGVGDHPSGHAATQRRHHALA